MHPKNYNQMKRTIFFFLFASMLLIAQAATYSGTLPVLYIQTENKQQITSKDYYLNATYYLDALGLAGYQSIGSASAPLTMEIKGRGNYTWRDFNKKPYRIKLADKQPLLGLNKSKHFALMAHADDAQSKKGFMRNQVGFELSRMIGMEWTPATAPVEVVLNGDYIGLYFLTETIRVDKDRVNIVEQEDEETNSEAITGGWLVEIDNYDEDPHITIRENGYYNMWFTYKTPEVLSSAQENFLTEEMVRIDRLVYGDKNSSTLWQYLDMDALAKFYIVQELTDNYESFHGSCYLHKEIGANEKWHFGPVWDFGSAFNRDKSQYIYQGDVWHNHWIPEICKYPAFMARVKEMWKEFYANDFNKIYSFIDAHEAQIAGAAVKDKERWPQYHGSQSLGTYIDRTTDVLRKNAAWLNEQWKDDNDNGSSGNDDGNENGNNGSSTMDYMMVWREGEAVEYAVAEVDSITFVKKEGIVLKAKVPAFWGTDIYVHIWNTEGLETGDYKASKQGDWYVYTCPDSKEINILFKSGTGWKGNKYQTEDIRATKSACYLFTQEGNNKATVTETDCSN